MRLNAFILDNARTKDQNDVKNFGNVNHQTTTLEIRFLRDNPDFFVVPQFPSDRGFGKDFIDASKQLFFVVLMTALVMLVELFLLTYLLLWMIGDEVIAGRPETNIGIKVSGPDLLRKQNHHRSPSS